MLNIILLAVSTTISAVLIVHLGLSKEIARISNKILNCSTCLTFWVTLSACYFFAKQEIIICLIIAISCAYSANYVSLIFIYLNKLYNKLWQKLNNQN